METVLLDFEITDDQLRMMTIHNKIKEAHGFDDFKYLEVDFDKVQVWFCTAYNDNWWDLTPIYADLIKNDKIIKKVKIGTWGGDLELRQDEDSGGMISYTAPKKMFV